MCRIADGVTGLSLIWLSECWEYKDTVMGSRINSRSKLLVLNTFSLYLNFLMDSGNVS
jgi:hypothetical protein